MLLCDSASRFRAESKWDDLQPHRLQEALAVTGVAGAICGPTDDRVVEGWAVRFVEGLADVQVGGEAAMEK